MGDEIDFNFELDSFFQIKERKIRTSAQKRFSG